jgi:signal transduction histidine kinase
VGHLNPITTKRVVRAIVESSIAILIFVSITIVSYKIRLNLMIATLLCVVVIVLISRVGDFVSSVVASIAAAICLVYLAPPAYSFRVGDPLDVVAILAFLLISFVIAHLVSNLRRMREEALSSVNRVLIDAEERERARIGRELHDDIGQRLAMLEIKVEQLRTDVPHQTSEDLVKTDQLVDDLKEISSDIQALAHSLHSPKLEYLGLAKTVRSFCREFGNQYKMEIEFKSRDLEKTLPLDVSLCLFRVLQEALHNSAKHSGTRQSEVELFETQDTINLIVRDSGQGFELEMAMKNRGLGLVSMKERIKLVKGELSIDSQPNRGTTIRATVPFVSPN